jgi:hypothetical protein
MRDASTRVVRLDCLRPAARRFAGSAGWADGSPAPVLVVKVLAQGPAETKTELQIVCLFRSSPENALHGSLIAIDERLHGLLTRIRSPGLFGGELGETIVLTPPAGSLGATRFLLLGLGDSSSFTAERMYLVGKIALREADRLGVAHPFFAPTVLDGGVSGFPTGAVAYQVVRGMRDALASEAVVRGKGAGTAPRVTEVTFLAGAAHVADTQGGVDRAMSAR